MTFLLILGSIVTLAGFATIAFAHPLAAKMRRDEARWGNQGTSTRTFIQTPGRMRAYGVSSSSLAQRCLSARSRSS